MIAEVERKIRDILVESRLFRAVELYDYELDGRRKFELPAAFVFYKGSELSPETNKTDRRDMEYEIVVFYGNGRDEIHGILEGIYRLFNMKSGEELGLDDVVYMRVERDEYVGVKEGVYSWEILIKVRGVWR